MNPQILLYELTRAIGVANLPRTAEHLQGLTKFAKELYSTIHQLKNAAWGDGDGSGESSGRTSRKPKPSRLGGEGNEGGEEGGEREEKEEGKAFNLKERTKTEVASLLVFSMFPVLVEITQGADDQGKEEFRRTEEYGAIVVEQTESEIESP